jgi:hypothetical protein
MELFDEKTEGQKSHEEVPLGRASNWLLNIIKEAVALSYF